MKIAALSGLAVEPPLAPPFQGGELQRARNNPPLEKGGKGGDPPGLQDLHRTAILCIRISAP
jgi:hypothetical protein